MRHRRRTTALPARVHRSVVGLAAIGLLASGTLSAPGAVESTEIALQDAGTITWFVEDDAGSAVHGTTYEVTGPDGWSLEVGDNLRTDTNTTHGTVTIDGLPDGKFTITPTGPEDVVFGGAQSVEVSEGVQDAGTPIAFVVAQALDEHEPAVEEEADPVKATKEPAPVEDEEPVEPTDAPGEGNQAGVEAEELGEAIDGETAEEESAHQFATEETPADEIAATDDRPTGETGPVADGMATARFAPNRFPTPAPADNPELPQRCGLDIAIVLDLSNSLSNTDVAASQDAAVGFADALQGTPSSVGVYTFATYAPDRTNAPLGKTSVATGAGANQVSAHIRNLSRVPTDFGGTNWDRGFSQVPTGEYDVIVFITDGNPTAYGQPGVWNQWTGRWDIAAIPTGNTDRGTATDQVDINTGTASSNAHKTAGTFVIGLGVGAVDADNISYISGNRLNTDYFLIANYGELAAALETIALENCLGTLTVVKQERALDGSLSRGQDWTFSTADPDVSPASGQTDSNGAVNFEVGGFTDEITQRSITVSEVQQPGFSLEQQSGYNAACTDNVTGSPVPVTNGGVLGFTVEVAYDAAISCQMINTQHPTVTLQKSWVNAMAGDSATLTINGQPTAPVVVSEVGDSSTFDDTTNVASLIVSPGQQVNVTELLDATGHYVTDLNCVGAEVSYTGGDLTGSFTMPAQNVACTFTNALEFSDLTVTKTAVPSFDRAYSWSIDKVAGTDRIEIPEGETASADYDVTVTAQDRVDSNIAVTGVITVANPNAISFAASVTDSLPGASCTVEGGSNVTVPANGTLDVNYACTADSIAAVADTNEATVTWDVATYPGTTGTASGTAGVTFGDPASETDRTVRIEDVFDGADPVLLPLDGGPVELDWVELTAGEGSYTVSYEREVPGEAGACTDYLNTASVIGDDDASLDESSETVTVCVGADLEVAKNVVHSYDRTYAFEVDKSVDATRKNVDPDTGEATFDYTVTVTDGPSADSNWVMSGTITVHNPNSWTDITADVTDTVDIDGGASCVVTDGAGAVVPAGSSLELDYTCTFTEQPSYDGTNTATAVWAETLPTPNSSASGTAAVSADEWDVRSINQTVTVLDDQTDPTAPVELGEHTWSAEGTSTNYTYQLTLEGTAGECVSFTNTAWIDELPDSGDSQDVTVCWPQDLTVTKTVGATYDTEYFWDLSKEVDRTEATVAEDGTAEFTYVVTATPDGSQDSGWAMAGEITVANPNATDVTVDVTDTAEGLGDGVTCTVTDSELSVPAHGEASTAYACTFDEQPAYDGGTNTATITWTGVDDVEQTATHVVDVDFTQDEQTNVDVQVWDDEVTQAAPGELLGTAIWSDGPQEFTYTLSLPGEASTCVDHTNTAVIPKTGDVADQTVWVCVELAPQVEKTAQASFDREYFWDIVKEADRTEATVTEGGAATFDYVVSATPDGSQDSGWAMNGQVTVTNPNTFDGGDLTVTVTDVPSVGGECTVVDGADAVLAPAETRSFDYTCAFEEEPEYAGTNLATVAWTGAGGTSGTVTVEADVDFILDGETNATVEVFDDKVTGEAPGVSLGVADWHEGGEEFAYSLELSGVAGECTDHTNTALIPATGDGTEETVTVCTEAAPEVAKTADASFDREYFWDLTKVADATQVEIVGDEATFSYLVAAIADGFQDSGWEMSGEITVTNPNTFQELTATVTDLTDVGGTCVVEDGEDFVLAAGETRSLDYACTFGEQPAYLGSNTAHVAWTDLDGVDQVSSSDPVAFEFQLDGETNLEVEVRDDKVSGEAPGELLGSATWHDGTTEFGYELTLPGTVGECVTHTNTAVIPDTGDEAQVDVTICVEDELVITKTAEADYDREYFWDLAKDVDQTEVTLGEDDTATFNYAVTATPDPAFVDSGWSMRGQLSVTNPNAYAEGTVTVEVTDESTVGGNCAVIDGKEVVVAPGATEVFDYDCTFTEQPAYEGTNSATVTWTGADGTERVVTTEVPVVFDLDQETNESVVVYDDKVTGLAPGEPLGSVEWNADGTATTFEYALDLPGVAGECVDHTNTAVIPAAGDEAQQVVTVCSTLAPEVSKTAVADFDRDYDWSITKEVDRTRVVLTEDGTAQFDYVVSAVPQDYSDSGWVMDGQVTVTNPNTFDGGDLTVTVTDVPSVGGVCAVADGEDLVLAPGQVVTLDYSCSFEEKPEYAGTNRATVAWSGPGETSGTATAEADVDFVLDGETNLEVEVYDDMVTGEAPGDLLGTATWNAEGTPIEFAYSLDLPGEVGSCVDHTNTAVLQTAGTSDVGTLAVGDQDEETVTVCIEAAPEVAKTADASFDREYFWDLSKVADATQVEIVGDEATFSYLVAAIADGFQDSGWEMSGEITVTNPNDFREMTVSVADVPDVGGTCAVTEGEDIVLTTGETRVLGYECTFGEKPAYEGSNTAHVAWTTTDGADQVTSSDPVPVTFDLDEETNLEVDVRDDKVSGEAPGELLGSATWHDGTTEFGYELTLPGVLGECVTHTNTAVISDTGDEAQADVTICVEDELVITKTAEAAFDRDYAWNLAKEADQTQVTIAPGGAATFDYTVSATPGDYVDSNWSMSGQISVTNPNAYAEGTVTVEVTDEPSVGGSCAVVEGEDVVLAPGETRVFDYDCTFTEQPDYVGTNSATVTWSGPDGAERAVTTQVPVTFEVDGETNRSVEVTDDKVTGEAPGDLLGTAEWNAEGTPTLFEYSLTLPGEAGTCVDHTNTAVIPAAGDEAQQVVTVCVEAAPQVAKTVEASYDRSYDWQLAKEVDRTSIELTEPGAALFTYVVTATPDGYTDSGWAMSGEVTVTNPNDFQEMAITVSDEATVGGSCVVAEGEDVVLAAGETRVLDYECTFEEQPDYEGSNTAVVTWTDVDGAEQVTSSVAVDVSFAMADEAHLEVEVYDDMVTGEAPGELLGTADWRDGPTEFTYGLELDGVADQCVDYTNTAVISATGDEAQQTVHVCVAEEAAPEPPIVPEPVDPTPVEPEPVDPTPVVPEPVDPTPVEPEPVDPTPVVPEPVDPTSPAPPAVVIPTGDPVASGPQVALVVSGLAAMLLALLGAVLVLRRRQD